MACREGDAEACLGIEYFEEACELGDLDGCVGHWGEAGPAAWEAAALSARCETDEQACSVLADYGWTLPFRRLAATDEPVFVGPMRFVDGGGLLVSPSGDPTAKLFDPADGALLGEVDRERVQGFESSRQQESYTAQGGGYTAELERGVLRVTRGDSQVATVRGGLPLSPMSIEGGRLVIGGRLVFDLDPEPTDAAATLAWLVGLPPAPTPSSEPGELLVRVEGASGPLRVHLYDTSASLEPIRVAEADEAGEVAFAGLPPAIYELQAANVDGGGSVSVRVEGGLQQETTIALEPGDVVTGVVRTRLGRPVAGALVYTEHYLALPVETDARGAFALPVQLAEGESVTLYAETSDSLSRSVEVDGGPARLRLLPQGHRDALEVRTIGQGGDPVDGAVEVDVAGQVRLADQAGTTWVIRPEGEDVTVRARWGRKRVEALVPADERLMIVLFTNASVHVAASAMTLRLEDGEGQVRRLAQGSTLAEAEITLLPAGDYVLWRSSSAGLERHDFALEGSQQLSLVPPFEPAGVRVSGRLVEEDGEPLIGVRIRGFRMDDFGPLEVLTNLDGTFTIDGIHPGTHRFELVQETPDGWRHFEDLEVEVPEEGVELGSVLR